MIQTIVIFLYCDNWMNTELQYKVFDWLRFPLIVGVVLIHSYGKPFDFDALDFDCLSGIDYYNLFRVGISQVLAHVCVPTFYFISGFLFFIELETWDKIRWLNKIKRRFKTLLVPFFIWNTISIIIALIGLLRREGLFGAHSFFIDNGYWHLYWDCMKWNLDRTNWLGCANPSSSPYLVQFWFLRDLMVVVACSPLLYYIIRKTKGWMIFVLFVCYVSGVFFNIPGFSITAFFFFSLGAYMKIYSVNPTVLTYRYRYGIVITTIILWLACTLYNGHNTKEGDIIYPFYVVFCLFSLLNIVPFIIRNRLIAMPKLLSKSTFFIYCSHTIILLPLFNKMMSKILGEVNPIGMTVSYLMAPILTIISCILLYYLLNRYFPSICDILTGDR